MISPSKTETDHRHPAFGATLVALLVALLSGPSVASAKAVPAKAKAPAKPAVAKAKAVTPTLTPDQIIARMDRNTVFETRRTEAVMIIRRRGRVRPPKKMLIYSKGQTTSYSEFLSPARDKGVKYLKLGDNLWMYLPSAEKVIKISGHMLRRSMMGSDFSYEDMLDAGALRTRYRAKVVGTQKVGGKDCYVLELKQKKRGETYPTRKIWVQKTHYFPMRFELFAASGRLLKVMTFSKVMKYGERHYPTVIRMQNKLKRGTWTEMRMTKIAFKVKLPSQIFSRRNLERE